MPPCCYPPRRPPSVHLFLTSMRDDAPMANLIEHSDSATVAIKTASYGGAGVSIGAALTLTDWGIIVGIATALLTFALNVWWIRNKYTQSQRREAREIEEHNARLKALGFESRHEFGRNQKARSQKGKVTPKLVALLAASSVSLITAAGLITHWESGNKRPLTAYQDIVGVWTICDGITSKVKAGQRETEDGCDQRLYQHLKMIDLQLAQCVTPLAPDNAYAAVISLAYNVGVGSVCQSTLVKKLNKGDILGACNELPRWVYAGGRRIQGLVNRREAERAICMRDVT